MADFYKFAEEAIEMAGEAGERKRKQALTIQQKGARSRLAELERAETGATRRQAMIEAGTEARHKREYGRPWGARPEAQQGFRYAELAAKGGEFGKKERSELKRKAYDTVLKDYDPTMPAIHPKTGKEMTPAEVRTNLYDRAEDLYSRWAGGEEDILSEQPRVPRGRGWLKTAGGRRFDVTQGGMGFKETTPTGRRVKKRQGLMGGVRPSRGYTGSW